MLVALQELGDALRCGHLCEVAEATRNVLRSRAVLQESRRELRNGRRCRRSGGEGLGWTALIDQGVVVLGCQWRED
jgi:hypothetical protein